MRQVAGAEAFLASASGSVIQNFDLGSFFLVHFPSVFCLGHREKSGSPTSLTVCLEQEASLFSLFFFIVFYL